MLYAEMEKTKNTILDSFSKLINGNDKERIDSGIKLLKYLSEQNWVRFTILVILNSFIAHKKLIIVNKILCLVLEVFCFALKLARRCKKLV